MAQSAPIGRRGCGRARGGRRSPPRPRRARARAPGSSPARARRAGHVQERQEVALVVAGAAGVQAPVAQLRARRVGTSTRRRARATGRRSGRRSARWARRHAGPEAHRRPAGGRPWPDAAPRRRRPRRARRPSPRRARGRPDRRRPTRSRGFAASRRARRAGLGAARGERTGANGPQYPSSSGRSAAPAVPHGLDRPRTPHARRLHRGGGVCPCRPRRGASGPRRGRGGAPVRRRARPSRPAGRARLGAASRPAGRGALVPPRQGRSAAGSPCWWTTTTRPASWRRPPRGTCPARTRVGFLPSRGVAYGSGLDPAPHLVGERARALELLARGGLVAVSADALAERVPAARRAPGAGRRGAGSAARPRRPGGTAGRGGLRARRRRRRPRPARGARRHRRRLPHRPVRTRCASSSSATRSSASRRSRCSPSARCTSDSATIYPAAERLVDGAGPRGLDRGRRADARAARPRARAARARRLAALAAWEPGRLREELAEHLEEVGEHLPPDERGRAYVRLGDATELIEGAARLDPLAAAPPMPSRPSAPRSPGRGLSEAENELRGLVDGRPAGARHLPPPRRRRARAARSAARRGPAARRRRAAAAYPRRVLRRLARAPRVRLGGGRPRRAALDPGLPPPRAAPTGVPAASAARSPSFADLRPGDYVVHEDHGVGRFLRFDIKTVAGRHARLRRAPVPWRGQALRPARPARPRSRATSAPTRRAPSLSKLGGKAWQTLKTRARVAVHELAGELLALYAQRQTRTPAAVRRRRGLDGAARGRLPLLRDRGPGAGHRGRQGRPRGRQARWTA